MELALKNVEPGMIAYVDVRDRMGRILVPSGTALDERKIKMLKAWGIHSVNVTGNAAEQESPLDLHVWQAKALTLIDPQDREHVLVAKLLPFLANELAKSTG